MLRLVLLTTAFTLVAAAASLNCVDKEVPSNRSEIKTFTERKGQLLFYPDQGFDGVTINFVVHNPISTTISSEKLCINCSRWYKLEVTVKWARDWKQYCSFQVDTCSGSCGEVRDWSSNNFKSFTVIAQGASFWSVKNTHQENQCNTPVSASLIPSDASDGLTIPAIYPPESGKVLMPWLVGIGSVVGAVAAVVAMVCSARKTTKLCSPRAQQGQDVSSVRGTSLDMPQSLVYVSSNSLYEYEPFDNTGLGTQQSHADGLSIGCPSPGAEGAVYVITNSLYEPLGAITDTGLGERQNHDDGLSSGSAPDEIEEPLYMNT